MNDKTMLQKEKETTTKDISNLSEELNDNVTLRGIKELFNVNNENIDIKTELEDREIRQITRLFFLGKEFKIKEMEIYLTKFLRLRLSKTRQSRKEIIDMIKADLTNELQMANSNKFLLKGLGGLK